MVAPGRSCAVFSCPRLRKVRRCCILARENTVALRGLLSPDCLIADHPPTARSIAIVHQRAVIHNMNDSICGDAEEIYGLTGVIERRHRNNKSYKQSQE